jgi:AcrR family transcriptional regulator
MRLVLDRPSVLAAGCALVRRDGIEALGVRSVAGALGSTPMALYRYVSDAVDLRDSVLALLLESLPDPPGTIERLADWAHAFRGWLREVPGLPRVVLLRWSDLPPLLDTVESLLQLFAAEGFDGFELVAAANSMFTWVLSRGELEESVRSRGVRRSLRWETTSAARPLLTSHRREYEVARLDAHFTYGLDLLLRGLLGAPGEVA